MTRRNNRNVVTTRANNDGEGFRKWLVRSLLTIDGLLISVVGIVTVNFFRT